MKPFTSHTKQKKILHGNGYDTHFQNEISFAFAIDFSRLIRLRLHITLCVISALSPTEQQVR